MITEDTYNGNEGIDKESWWYKLNKKKYEEAYKDDKKRNRT